MIGLSASGDGEVAPNVRGAANVDGDGVSDMRGAGIDWSVDTGDQAAWDRFAAGFADASYDQCALYMDNRWPNRTCRIRILENGDPIGGAIVAVLKLPVVSTGLAYVKSGPLWRPCDAPADTGRLETVLRVLIEEFARRRGLHLIVLPRPIPEILPQEEEVLRRLGFSIERALVDPNRYLVNCALSSDEQLKSLDQKWRYNLRKSWKNDFEIRIGSGDEDVRMFTELHGQMRARKGYGDHEPIDLIPKFAGALPEALSSKVYLVLHRGEPVAGAIVARQGEAASYLFGATSEAALPLRAGYAMQWAILEDLRDSSHHWYDLGGEAGEPGLRQFKKGLVGRSGCVLQMPGEFEYRGSRMASLAAGLIFKARDVKRLIKERRR